MRRSFSALSIAVSLVFLTTSAFAQKKGKGAKKEAEGPSAAATWTDPVENEKLERALGAALLGEEYLRHTARAETPDDLEVSESLGRGPDLRIAHGASKAAYSRFRFAW